MCKSTLPVEQIERKKFKIGKRTWNQPAAINHPKRFWYRTPMDCSSRRRWLVGLDIIYFACLKKSPLSLHSAKEQCSGDHETERMAEQILPAITTNCFLFKTSSLSLSLSLSLSSSEGAMGRLHVQFRIQLSVRFACKFDAHPIL
jgi:hypothetical protein